MKSYIKSPLNYVGGKHKLLPQIVPLFPSDIDTFVDLFCGGCNVGINIKAKNIKCNDIQTEVMSLMNYLKNSSVDSFLLEVSNIINFYGLSRSDLNGYEFYGVDSSQGLVNVNKRAFEHLRDDYNNGNKTDAMFYTLVIYSFNNAIRFNEKGIYNQSCNKRDFNKNVKKSLDAFLNGLSKCDISFDSNDFRKFNIEKLKSNDFVYCDPPYLISGVAYNENNHGWTEKDEIDLYYLLDKLHSSNIKFALSNITENKGKKNDVLIKWANKYNVIDLRHSYKNSYFSSKDKSENSTNEVLITNY